MTEGYQRLMRQCGKYLSNMSLGQKASVFADETIEGLRHSDDELFAYMENNYRHGGEELKFLQSTARLQIADLASAPLR